MRVEGKEERKGVVRWGIRGRELCDGGMGDGREEQSHPAKVTSHLVALD